MAPAACACVTSAQVEAFYSAAAGGGAKMTAAQIAEARRMAGVEAEVTLRSVRRLWMRFRAL
jgi:hypothetical protein